MSRPKKAISPVQGERLRKERKRMHMTQTQVEIKTGLSQRNISKYETNSVELPEYAAEKLGCVFGVLPTYLQGVSEWRTSDDIPRQFLDLQEKAGWEEEDVVLSLLALSGYTLERTDVDICRDMPVTFEGRTVQASDYDMENPNAYDVCKYGAQVCRISLGDKEALIEGVSENAKLQIELLIKRRSGGAGNA